MALIESELSQAGLQKAEARELVKIAITPDVLPAPPALSFSTQWPDVPQEHWAAAAVRAVTESGLMNGYPDGMFRGQAPLTRYEIAVILKRLIERLGIKAEPHGESLQVAPMIPRVETPTAMPAMAPTTHPASNRQQLLSKLQARGFTREQAEIALEAIQESEVGVARRTTNTAPRKPTARLPGAPPPLVAPPSTSDPGLLGQSGLLATPTADLHRVGTVSGTASIMADGDSRALAATTSLQSGTEVTATLTSGDMPDAVMLSAKHPIHISADGSVRVAIGVLDVTDEADTTFYAVGSKDISADILGRRRPVTLSAGLGGGDLLEGLFVSGFAPLGPRTAAIVEWADVGHDDEINLGVAWAVRPGMRVKAGAVDGDFAASLSLNRRF